MGSAVFIAMAMQASGATSPSPAGLYACIDEYAAKYEVSAEQPPDIATAVVVACGREIDAYFPSKDEQARASSRRLVHDAAVAAVIRIRAERRRSGS